MPTYYNENDPVAARWLVELMKQGQIPDGLVDERSIEDVCPEDLDEFTQCHFFAGIGGWAYALQLAGWPTDRPVWTGSCPCQPFSAAGKGGGVDDKRHLWPSFFWLIRQCRPGTVFGEQVASKAGRMWIDLVSADLEREGYAFGACDLAAASVGAPHIRQRHYWVADTPRERGHRSGSTGAGRRHELTDGSKSDRMADTSGLRRSGGRLTDSGESESAGTGAAERRSLFEHAPSCGDADGLADATGIRPSSGTDLGRTGTAGECERSVWREPVGPGHTGSGVADTTSARCERPIGNTEGEAWHEARMLMPGADSGSRGVADARGERRQQVPRSPLAYEAADGGAGRHACEQDGDYLTAGDGKDGIGLGHADDTRSQGRGECGDGPDQWVVGPTGLADWADADYIYCTDEKYRPVEPGTFPLAHGVPARVGRLRGYGNAIVPQVAAEFIKAYTEA